MSATPLLQHSDTFDWHATNVGTSMRFTPCSELFLLPTDVWMRRLCHEGVRHLGTFTVQDASVSKKFGDSHMLTFGCNNSMFDWRSEWSQRLGAVLFEAGQDELSRLPSEVLRYGVARRSSSLLWATLRSAVEGRRLPDTLRFPQQQEVVVEAYVVTVRDAAAWGDLGLLRPLLRLWQAGLCTADVFTAPAVRAIIGFKWDNFARHLLMAQLVSYVVWLGGFTAFIVLLRNEDPRDSLAALWASHTGRAALVAEGLALCGMLPFAWLELFTINAYRWGWVNFWSMLDLATYLLQLTISVLHVSRWHALSGLSIVTALQCVLLWIRLQYFTRVFRGMSFDFVGVLSTVMVELRWYLLVMLLMMWGFATAFYTLFRDPDDTSVTSFSTLPLSVLTMFSYAVGGAAYYLADLAKSRTPLAASIMCIAYQFIVSMVLMSMLVGVMSSALSKSTECAALKLVTGRAEIVDELELIMPRWVHEQRVRWHPRYLHVLRLGARCAVHGGTGDGGDGAWEQQAVRDSTAAKGAPASREGSMTLQPHVAARLIKLEGQLGEVHALLQELVARTLPGGVAVDCSSSGGEAQSGGDGLV